MALRFVDSMSHYSTLLEKWDNTGEIPYVLTSSSPRRAGGKSVTPPNWYGACLKILGNQSTWIVGHAAKMMGGNESVATFWDGTTCKIQVTTNLDGTLRVNNGAWTLLGTSLAIPFNVWIFIEVKVVIHASAGSVEIRVNGDTLLSISGVVTSSAGNAYANLIGVGQPSGQSDPSVSAADGQLHTDWYMCDGTGTTNNDFLGDCVVECLLPTGAGAESQWTPSAGSNYENVDEALANGDTDYNKSNTVGQVDTYAMADLVSATGLIYGVQYVQYARKDNAGTRKIAGVARIGSADYPGNDINLYDAYRVMMDIQEKSPSTAAAWTISEINAMEYGAKVTA